MRDDTFLPCLFFSCHYKQKVLADLTENDNIIMYRYRYVIFYIIQIYFQFGGFYN